MSNSFERLTSNINKKFKEFMPWGKVVFRAGNSFSIAAQFASRQAPCGKIAVLYKKASHTAFSEQVNDELIKRGNRPVSVIMPDIGENNLKNLCKLFELPEDVRAVITFDHELFDACAYFGGIRGIPTAYAIVKPQILGSISPAFIVKSENALELVKRTAETCVIIDYEKIMEGQSCMLFAQIESAFLCLIDYRTRVKFGKIKLNKCAYDTLTHAVNNTLKVLKINKEKQWLLLIENAFNVELANILSGGVIYQNSAIYSAKQILGEDFEGHNRLQFVKRVTDLLGLATVKNSQLIKGVPDYNQRAEKLGDLFNIDDAFFMQNLLIQKQVYGKKNTAVVLSAGKKASTISKLFSKRINNMLQIYYAIGGTDQLDDQKINLALKYCGDVFSTANSVTILREMGLLEVIEA